MAGGDSKGLVIVYDMDCCRELFRWCDVGQIRCVDLSFDGERLGTCGDSKTAYVFHMATGAQFYTILCLHYRLTNLPTNQQTGAQIFQKKSVDRQRTISLSRDGEKLATKVGGRLEVNLIDHGARFRCFEVGGTVHSISIDRKGFVVAVGCDDGCVYSYDLTRDVSVPLWTAKHHEKVWVVRVSPDGRYVAAGDYADEVRAYDADSGGLLWSNEKWAGKSSPFTWGLAFAGNSATLAIGRWDKHAYVVDTETWSLVGTVKRADRVYCVALDHLGQRLAVGGRDRIAIVYSLTQEARRNPGQIATVFSVELEAFIYAISISEDGRKLAVGFNNTVRCYAINNKCMTYQVVHGGRVQSIAYSRDATHLAIGGEHSSVDVWKLDDRPEHVLVLPRNGSVSSVAFSAVSLAFASGSLATIYGTAGAERECEVSKICL